MHVAHRVHEMASLCRQRIANFRPRMSTGIEFVVHLPIVNAPFRIFWAYNLNRYNAVIHEPIGAYDPHNPIFNTLPAGVFDSQIQQQLNAALLVNARKLNYFEPLKTFRFTVSRTF